MDAICDDQGRPACRLHGLRMLDPAIFQHLPFASADSTNAAVNGGSISRFGMYAPPTAGQRADVIDDRIELAALMIAPTVGGRSKVVRGCRMPWCSWRPPVTTASGTTVV